MRIELLYFTGCPSWQTGLSNLRSALREEGIAASVELVRVEDDAQADRLKFLGSPHFRVNGQDLWPEVRDTFALSCRLYATPEGMRGSPTIPMLRQQLHTFQEA